MALHIDASSDAAGGALHQCVDGTLQPLAFFSRRFTATQCHYSTFDKELSAMYIAIKHFWHFVEGSPLTVCTDHQSLTFTLTKRVDNDWTPRQTALHFFHHWICYIHFCLVVTTWLQMHCHDLLFRPLIFPLWPPLKLLTNSQDIICLARQWSAPVSHHAWWWRYYTNLRHCPWSLSPFCAAVFSSRHVRWAPRFVSSWHRRVAMPHCWVVRFGPAWTKTSSHGAVRVSTVNVPRCTATRMRRFNALPPLIALTPSTST